ncbi:MAG: nucleoside monophosphate kinase [Candidatus Nanohaloarchaeota archaeon QJJ-7]|nr:nucleoside monophosphate kinase [Candidatus Nanohaloarchaeota archaeon QJJ-7]
MNLIVLGLPGAGKGTQADRISQSYGVPHISMGDLLRNNKDFVTDSGETVGEIIDAGNPVTTKTSSQLLSKRLDRPDCDDGFVLDGFPRWKEQAEAMEEIADIDAVLILNVDEENIYERLTKRRVCPECGSQYHLKYDPPEEERVCDECGTELVQREDDTREGIKERIEWQQEGIEEIRDFYEDRGLIEDVDGNQSIEEVWEDVQEVVEKYD